VSATFEQRSGTIHADVRNVGCEDSTISPASLTSSAFHAEATVTVTTPLSDCRWKVVGDKAWLPSYIDPRLSGSGSFRYTVPDNNYPDPRTGHLIVVFSGGFQPIHTVTQEKPRSCSYVVKPERVTFGRKEAPHRSTSSPRPARVDGPSRATAALSRARPSQGIGLRTRSDRARTSTRVRSRLLD